MNKLLFDRIQSRLTEKGVKFTAKNGTIIFNMNVGEVVGKLALYIDVLNDSYVSYAILSNKATEDRYALLSEYLHRANFGLLYGNFEIDYSDGEIRYKITTDCEDANKLTNNQIDRSVVVPCAMFGRYGGGIIKLLVDDASPEVLIKEAEKTTKE